MDVAHALALGSISMSHIQDLNPHADYADSMHSTYAGVSHNTAEGYIPLSTKSTNIIPIVENDPNGEE